MIAIAATGDAACILAWGVDLSLIHAIDDVNLHCIVLTCTSNTASTQTTSNRATLVDDEVLDDGTLSASIGIAAERAKETLHFTVGTVDNHVLDAMSLSVERSVVLSAICGADRAVQVDDIFEVDVVH